MAKELSARVGSKIIVVEDNNPIDEEFTKAFKKAAKTSPKNLQEFLERLVEEQEKIKPKRVTRTMNSENSSDRKRKK